MNNIKLGIEDSDIESIRDNSLPTPCPYCGIDQSLICVGSQPGVESNLILGCEECDALFILDAKTGLMQKHGSTFTSLYSLTYSKMSFPNGPALVKVVHKKY